MNLLLKELFLACVGLYCITLQSMEKKATIKIAITQEQEMEGRTIVLTKEQALLQAVTTRNNLLLETLLSSFATNFVALAELYVCVLTQAQKLTPNKELRRECFWQEVINKIQSRRKIALYKLTKLDITNPILEIDPLKSLFAETIQNKKTRIEQIDETLIDQGKLFVACIQKIRILLEPLVKDEIHINTIYFLLGFTGYVDLVKDFAAKFEYCIDWNYADLCGRTLLHMAAKEGIIDMIGYLLSKQIDCNKQTYYAENKDCLHKTPLHYAVENSQTAIVKRLLAHNSDPNIPDYFGNLPLHYVAPGPKGNKKIFEMLVYAGANIDCFDKDGKTLLYKAVKLNNPDIVNYLLSLGADPNLKSKNNTYTYYEDEDYKISFISYSESPSDLALRQAIVTVFHNNETYSKNNALINLLLFEAWVNPILVGSPKRRMTNNKNMLL